MKKNLLLLSLLAIIGFSISCSEDDPAPNPYVAEWLLGRISFYDPPADYSETVGESESLYGETAFSITFEDDENFKRIIKDIPGFGTFQDAGTYTINDNSLVLRPVSGDVNAGVNNIFTIIEEPDDADMLLEISVSTIGIADSVWNDSSITDDYDLTSSSDIALFYETYGEEIQVNGGMTFLKQ